jgi:hypothetical protein
MFRALPSQAIAYYLWGVEDRVGMASERFRDLMERNNMYMKKVAFDGLSCSSVVSDDDASNEEAEGRGQHDSEGGGGRSTQWCTLRIYTKIKVSESLKPFIRKTKWRATFSIINCKCFFSDLP